MSKKRQTLADFIPIKNVYPAGRLDRDSEGLVLLTDDGRLQHKIAHPKNKWQKIYWVQVEGEITAQALEALQKGVTLKDGPTLPSNVKQIHPPVGLWERKPPVRFRKSIPTSWVELSLSEGRNRQVRRMTAAVNFPTLRLVRIAIGNYRLGDLVPGDWKKID